MKPKILIGAGKGKLLPVLNMYLTELGIPAQNPGRKLVYEIEREDCTLQIALLRWQDIRKNYNKFDLITYGTDQWLEEGHKAMIALKYFPQENCRLSLLVPEKLKDKKDSDFLQRSRVATSYPKLAREYLGVPSENILEMSGSVETAVGLGWADCIFDVVESGTTARENGLLEKKSYARLGAVLATCRPERIPLMINLGLIPEQQEKKIIAFEGNDGSGKSTVAKNVVQTGFWKNLPTVLVSPYSGDIGRNADSLRVEGMYEEWTSVVGKNHWRAPQTISAVYDRSILTCLTELLKHNVPEERILRVMNSWKEFPELLFLCKASMATLVERVSDRSAHDEFDEEAVLKEYEVLYDKAADYARKELGVNVIELNTEKPLEETLADVKKNLEVQK
ncbi:ATP phosphoribosyltransferase [archaeon]|nr:ATP phosphoribosyltransferase [archaeon]